MSGVLIAEHVTLDGRRIGHLQLNAPSNLNALTLEMIEQMLPVLRRWRHQPDLVAVLLDGAGDKAFCAGGDVVSLYQAIGAIAPAPPGELAAIPAFAARFFAQEYRLDHLLHTFGKPIVCWGSGIVMGGGMGLLMASSHRIVTETSQLAMPEACIGLYPDVGASWFLSRLPPGLGEFMALTGCRINGRDAHWLGLGTRAIAHAHRVELWPALLAAPNWHQPEAAINQVLRRLELGSVAALAALPSPLQHHQHLIRRWLDQDSLAEQLAAIDRLVTQDAWLQQAQQGLSKASPLALRVIHEQLRRSRHDSLAQVFRRELALSVQLCRVREFSEGVRARLVDKDNQPAWTFTRLEAVNETLLAQLFASPWPISPLADLSHPFQ